MPKARAKKIGFDLTISIFVGNMDVIPTILDLHDFSVCLEPVLIHRILISFEVILENNYLP